MASAAFFCHGNELATVTTATATLATATAATTATGNGTTSTSMESFLALAKSWEKLYC